MPDIAIRIDLQSAQALEKVNSFLETLSHGFIALFGVEATIKGFEELALKSFELAAKMELLHQRTGQTVDDLVGLNYIAGVNEISIDTMARGVKKLSEYLVKSGSDTGDVTKALLEQSVVFSKMPDGIGKIALAVERFGRSGEEMIPILNLGPEKLQEMIQRGQDLTGITEEMGEAAHQAGVAWKDFRLALESFVGVLAAGLLPMLSTVMVKMADWVAQLRQGLMFLGMGTAGSIAKAMEDSFGGVLEKQKDISTLNKEEYEQMLKQYELELSRSQLNEKIYEQSKDQTPESRQAGINMELQKQLEILQKIDKLHVAGLDVGILTKTEAAQKQQGVAAKSAGVSQKLEDSPVGVAGNMQLEWNKFVLSSGTIAHQIATNFVDIIGGAIKTVSAGITGLIMGTETWRAALLKIGTTILTSIVQSIVEMGVKWVVTHIIMGNALAAFHALANVLGWSTATQQIAQEEAKAPALAASATLASASSFGASAIIGIAALVAAIGLGVAAATGAFRESGGPVTAGMPYIVGERRPELFVPSQSGYILPQVPTGAGGGVQIHVHSWQDTASLNKHLRDNPDAHHILVEKISKSVHSILARA